MGMERKYMCSPLGLLMLEAEQDAVVKIAFAREKSLPETAPSPLLGKTERQLLAYFAGERRDFTLPVRLQGTPFQQKVWTALGEIPYGKTCTYGELAARIACPGGARAVGMALNKNPLVIVCPCHRVIGADGTLTGFGGGLEIKRKLLLLEGAVFR